MNNHQARHGSLWTINSAPRLYRFAAAVPAVLLALALTACGGGSDSSPAATAPVGTTPVVTTPVVTTTVVATPVVTVAGIGPAGGTIENALGVKVVVPAGALATTVSIAISIDATGAPSIASGVTSTGAVFALLPHGTSFATAVTITVPFDPALIPPGATPRLYKAEVGGSYTEIPSTVVGTTLVAQITGFSWVGSGVSGKPSAPLPLAELDDKAVRVSWTGVPGQTYQVCKDVTPNIVLAGSFYPSQCVSATAPYTFTGLANDTGYSFAVIASNSNGTAASNFVNATPKALARTWTAYSSGSSDPYANDPTTYGSTGYNDIAYLRKGGQDFYVAVKSTRQTMRIVDNGDPEHKPDSGKVLYTLRAVAAGNGYFVAVGDNGTIGFSDDGGLRWTYAQLGQFANEFQYKAIAYVPAAGNAPGRFIAVGSWYDSNSFARDLVTTIDPTVGSSGDSSFLPRIYHQKFDQGSNPYAVESSGVIVGSTHANYFTYSGTNVAIVNGVINYRVTGNKEAGTAAGATVVQSVQTSAGFDTDYASSIRIVQYAGQYWALTRGTGGLLSNDGVNWSGGSATSFQIHNPDLPRSTTGLVAGPGQMVAVSANGEFFYNSTGGNNISSWADVITNTQLGGAPRIVYGNGRYIAVGSVILKSN
jgi:hypothetical protein